MNLFIEVERAKTEADVTAAVKQWFSALPLLDNRTRAEHNAELWRETVELFRPEAPAAGLFDCNALLDQAKADPILWDGLRRYALDQGLAGHSIPPDLAKVVLTEAPTRRRGASSMGTPFNEELHMRYARAVWCVYHAGNGRYTLSTNDRHTNNAFLLVAKATGATFNEVRNAARGRIKKIDREVEYFAQFQAVNKSDIGRCK